MRTARRPRLSPETFQLPVDKMRDGYYSDAYFTFTRDVLERNDHHPRVMMQVFQRERSVLGGMDEALAILRLCSGRYAGGRGGEWDHGWDELDVRALYDGDEISPWETVLTIEGDYSLFATSRRCTSACSRGARSSAPTCARWWTPPAASRSSTSRRASTTSRCRPATGRPRTSPAPSASPPTRRPPGGAARAWARCRTGSSPPTAATRWRAAPAFADHFADELNVTVLVDFENDSVRTALEVADALGRAALGRAPGHLEHHGRPLAVARDGRFRPNGVVPELVCTVRRALDEAGQGRRPHRRSGGFDAGAHPGVRGGRRAGRRLRGGQRLLRGNDFTADVVLLDGRPCAKVGREERPNPRLEPVVLP